jgi:hypothetical protein
MGTSSPSSSNNAGNRPKITGCHLKRLRTEQLSVLVVVASSRILIDGIRHRGIYLCENNTKANMVWTHCSVAALQVGEKKGDREKKGEGVIPSL